MRGSFPILVLKEMVQDLEGVSVTSQRLLYQALDLQDHRTLQSYRMTSGSTITLTLRLPGGMGGVAPKTFVDGSQHGAKVIRAWAPTAPRWRQTARGLAIEGLCMNQECEAYRKRVVDNKHFETFDLMRDKAWCPCCHQEIRPLLPGFNNCNFRIKGTYREVV